MKAAGADLLEGKVRGWGAHVQGQEGVSFVYPPKRSQKAFHRVTGSIRFQWMRGREGAGISVGANIKVFKER